MTLRSFISLECVKALRLLLVSGLFCTVLLPFSKSFAEPAKVHLFAAASTTNPVRELVALMAREGGPAIVPVFAASGALARQIEFGAPADVFLSANPVWMDWLKSRKRLRDGTRRDLIGNCLVLARSHSRADKVSFSSTLLKNLGHDRLALGDPAYVPAGAYAMEALRKIGVWQQLSQNAVRLPSARHIVLLLERGEAGVGLLYRSDALSSTKIEIDEVIDPALYAEIVYPLSIIERAGIPQHVSQVYRFLGSDRAIAIFERHGFKRLGRRC